MNFGLVADFLNLSTKLGVSRMISSPIVYLIYLSSWTSAKGMLLVVACW
jgi:hypothetical protein